MPESQAKGVGVGEVVAVQIWPGSFTYEVVSLGNGHG